MIPLLKDGRKSKHDSNNYRAITLGSIISKLYDLIILNEQNHVFDTSQLQFGFKHESSTTQCTFVVPETIAHYVENDSSVYTLMLDASKAFDRVNYQHLFTKLMEKKCAQWSLDMLFMYTSQKLQVKWNDKLSSKCNVSNGVRQGAVLSPLLFGIYIDGLLIQLRELGIGCPTMSGLNKMIKVCERYAAEHNIIFNGKKNKLLIFNKKRNPLHNIEVNGENVPICTDTIYLGHKLDTNDMHSLAKEEIQQFNVRTNCFLGTFGKFKCSLKNKLFKQYCCTMYGSPLW
jgi:hypothetical protein